MKEVSILKLMLCLIMAGSCTKVVDKAFLFPLATGVTSTAGIPNANGATNIDVSIDSSTITPVLSGNIQSNLVILSASNNYVLTSPVASSSAYVVCNFQTTSSNANNSPSCQISNDGTSVMIQKNGGSAISVNYSVMSFSSGISVQRGSTTFVAGVASAILSLAVNVNRSFLILSARNGTPGADQDNRRFVKGSFADSTNLSFTCSSCNATTVVEWQVVQWGASSVTSNSVTLSDGALNTTANLPGSIDLSKSFLIFNYSYAPGINVGFEDNYMLRGKFSSSSQLVFERSSSAGVLSIQYFVISVTSGISVKSNDYTMTTAEATICDIIPSGGVTNYLKTMLLPSNYIGNESPSASNFDSASISYGYGVAGCGAVGNTHLSMTRNNVGNNLNPHTIAGTYFLIGFD